MVINTIIINDAKIKFLPDKPFRVNCANFCRSEKFWVCSEL